MNLDFGVIGAKTVLEALTLYAETEVAYNIVNSTKYPGWGYCVEQGATTIWETWDGNNLSLNHIMFGSVSAWIYKTIVGINPDPEHPGFKHFYVSPFYPSDLQWVKASYKTLYGNINVQWERNKEKITLTLSIPVNTSATITFPVQRIEGIKENGKIVTAADYLNYLGKLTIKYI